MHPYQRVLFLYAPLSEIEAFLYAPLSEIEAFLYAPLSEGIYVPYQRVPLLPEIIIKKQPVPSYLLLLYVCIMIFNHMQVQMVKLLLKRKANPQLLSHQMELAIGKYTR